LNILRVRCRNLEEFEEYYLPDVPNGGVFCPTTTELAPGTPVVVEMACDGLPNKVLIRGNVTAWRPALPRMRIRAGATVAFEAEEANKRDFVVKTLRGERPATRRRKHTRIPIGIPCKIRLTSASAAASSRATCSPPSAPTSSWRSCPRGARPHSICPAASSIMRGRTRPASASSIEKAAARGDSASWSDDSRLSRSRSMKEVTCARHCLFSPFGVVSPSPRS
jgi:Tfp pilus assembly protein PilZ